jgi:hypothetical protein
LDPDTDSLGAEDDQNLGHEGSVHGV